MKDSTKKALLEFLDGIPIIKRQLNPDFNQPMDFKRLIKVSIALADNEDTLIDDDIRSICEEVGGEQYQYMIANSKFIEEFAKKIISEINYAKNVISIYQEIKH